MTNAGYFAGGGGGDSREARNSAFLQKTFYEFPPKYNNEKVNFGWKHLPEVLPKYFSVKVYVLPKK